MSLESDNDALSGPQPATRVRLQSVEECLDRVEVTSFQRDYCPTLQQLLSYTDGSLQKYCNTAVKGDLSYLVKLAVAELRSSIYVKHSLRNICDNLSTISDSIQKLDYKVENCSLSSTAPQPVDGGVSGSSPGPLVDCSQTLNSQNTTPSTAQHSSNYISHNLLILGVPETAGSSKAVRNAAEKDKIDNILDLLEAKTYNIAHFHRRGKYNASHTKPRRIVVTFQRSWHTDLAKAKNLKDTSYFVKEDCTPESRILGKSLLSARYNLHRLGVDKSHLKISSYVTTLMQMLICFSITQSLHQSFSNSYRYPIDNYLP